MNRNEPGVVQSMVHARSTVTGEEAREKEHLCPFRDTVHFCFFGWTLQHIWTTMFEE